MRYTGRSIVVLTAAALAVGAAPAAAETVYGITDEGTPSLVTFDSATPGTFTSDVEVTGVAGDIVGIDVRPATLQILLLDDAGQFYELDAFSGEATALGAANPPLANATDIDFNPTVDRIRIVGQDGTAAGADALGNARANPNNGALVDGDAATVGTQPDGDLKFVAADANAGDVPVVPATAYTNSFPASQTFPAVPTTGQFNLEAGNDVLVQQTNPNAGELTTRRPLGVDLDGPAGFDVVTDADGTTNRGYAAFQPAGAAAAAFYSVNTTTGPENALGKLGDFPTDRPVTDIAVAPTTPLLVALLDLPGGGQALSAFSGERPQDAGLARTAVLGLPAGTRLLGVDQRPATGALYGLGSDSRLYTVDVLTGRATVVGTAGPFTPALSGTDFGFDFNPQVDRVRITSDTGQNLRVNPDTGLGVVAPPSAADGAINGSTTSVTASAYTNSTSPAPAATTLYNLDTNRTSMGTPADAFTRQDPPNAGTQVDVGPLGQNLGAANGFDIWARFNHGFAASGGQLYNVNVAGAAMMAGNGGAVVSGPLGISGATTVGGLAVFDRGLVKPPAAPADPGTGGGGTPGTPVTPGAPTPAPAAPARSRSRISYSVSPRRDRSAPFRYTIRGRIVPRGSTPAVGVFDGGRVTVLAKKSGTTRTLKRKTARVTSAGRFSVRVTVPGRTLRKNRSGVVRLNLRFNGTDALSPSRAFPRARYR